MKLLFSSMLLFVLTTTMPSSAINNGDQGKIVYVNVGMLQCSENQLEGMTPGSGVPSTDGGDCNIYAHIENCHWIKGPGGVGGKCECDSTATQASPGCNDESFPIEMDVIF